MFSFDDVRTYHNSSVVANLGRTLLSTTLKRPHPAQTATVTAMSTVSVHTLRRRVKPDTWNYHMAIEYPQAPLRASDSPGDDGHVAHNSNALIKKSAKWQWALGVRRDDGETCRAGGGWILKDAQGKCQGCGCYRPQRMKMAYFLSVMDLSAVAVYVLKRRSHAR